MKRGRRVLQSMLMVPLGLFLVIRPAMLATAGDIDWAAAGVVASLGGMILYVEAWLWWKRGDEVRRN
jgi:hypothetical protein